MVDSLNIWPVIRNFDAFLIFLLNKLLKSRAACDLTLGFRLFSLACRQFPHTGFILGGYLLPVILHCLQDATELACNKSVINRGIQPRIRYRDMIMVRMA